MVARLEHRPKTIFKAVSIASSGIMSSISATGYTQKSTLQTLRRTALYGASYKPS